MLAHKRENHPISDYVVMPHPFMAEDIRDPRMSVRMKAVNKIMSLSYPPKVPSPEVMSAVYPRRPKHGVAALSMYGSDAW